jgi:hypothetical protein
MKDMAKVMSVTYGRSIVPDNCEPERIVKKYEAEKFSVELKPTGTETFQDLILQAEGMILTAHRNLIERREARADIEVLEDELEGIECKLAEKDSMYDVKKLRERKKQLEELIDECR